MNFFLTVSRSIFVRSLTFFPSVTNFSVVPLKESVVCCVYVCMCFGFIVLWCGMLISCFSHALLKQAKWYVLHFRFRNKRRWCSNFLPHYTIPDELRKCVEQQLDILTFQPLLAEVCKCRFHMKKYLLIQWFCSSTLNLGRMCSPYKRRRYNSC